MTQVDDETLMRFADGELDGEAMSAVEAAVNADPALQSRLEMFFATRSLAKEALAPMLAAPPPDRLVEAIRRGAAAQREGAGEPEPASNVVALPRKGPVEKSRPGWLLPLAASVAAVLGGGLGYWVGMGTPVEQGGIALARAVDAPLALALDTVESGAETGLGPAGRYRAIASFRNATEDLCREFEVDSPDGTTVVSVACRDAQEWRVSFGVAAPGKDDGYAPASSLESVDAYMRSIGAGEVMSADDERKALAGG